MPLQGSRGFRRTSELRPGAACVPSRVREEWQRAGRGGGGSGRGRRLAGVPLCELDSGRAGPSLSEPQGTLSSRRSGSRGASRPPRTRSSVASVALVVRVQGQGDPRTHTCYC